MIANTIAITNPALDHTHDLPVCKSDVATFWNKCSGVINYGKCRLNYQLLCLTSENGYLRVLRIVALTKFKVGDGAGAVSAVPSTVGGAGGLLTIGAGAGA